ncbi:LamG domain-containing protein [bacterium]|nr:LamG domain-containing protein [bacterium]
MNGYNQRRKFPQNRLGIQSNIRVVGKTLKFGTAIVLAILISTFLFRIVSAEILLTNERNRLEFKSKSNSFLFDQIPIVEIKDTRYVLGSIKNVLGATTQNINEGTSVKLIDPIGNQVSGATIFNVLGNKYQVKVPENVDFVPGKYRLLIDSQGRHVEKDFTWGVLAVNTNKSVFTLGENVFLQLASLDEKGHTLCNSNLKLKITSPNGGVEYTEVRKSGDCFDDNVTLKADYYSNFEPTQIGSYVIQLTNSDLGYTISDSFRVEKSVPFIIERFGPTRIFPKSDYKMKIFVTANTDYVGKVEELVPSSFKVNQKTMEGLNGKLLTWDVNLKKGESKSVEYIFDAPDISPELYVIGPLRIGEFSEYRTWKVASDIVATLTDTYLQTGTWVAPDGVTSASVEVWGGGGAGGGATGNPAAGGGGAGGTYAKKANFSVTAGNSYTTTVGAAKTATTTSSASTNTGNVSWFSSNDTNGVVGEGGPGGAPVSANSSNGNGGTGSTANSFGDGGSVFAGGNASNGNFTSGTPGGAGGGGAGSSGVGGNASAGTGGTGSSTGGGNGANGVANSTAGAAGTTYGGGGSGGKANSTTDRAGGTGAAGAVAVTYSADFPKVEATSTGRDSTDATSHTITMPSGINVGELLIIVFSVDGNPTVTIGSGNWTKLGQASNGTTVTQAIFYKVAEGSDTATVSTSSTQEASHIVYRISGAGDTISGTSANGSSTNSNPPNHNPGTTNNYLWIATRGGDAQVVASVPPTNFANYKSIGAQNSTGASSNTSTRVHQASSLDPGTWTSTTEQWVSYTISVPPPVTLSGAVYTDEIGTNIGANKTVDIRINGTGSYTDETDNSGAWTINVPSIASGAVITAYLDDETEEGTIVMVSDGTSKSDIHIVQNRVFVRHDTGSSITPDNLFSGDDGDDDVKYSVSASSNGNLTVDSGFELHVWPGDTFDASGGSITLQGGANLHVDDTASVYLDTSTNTIAGDALIDGSATLRINANTDINGGDITTSGTNANVTTTSGSPTVTISGTGSIGGGTTPSFTFHNLNTSGTGTTTLSNAVTANNDVTVGSGTTLRINSNLNVNGGDLVNTTTGIIDYTSGTPTVTLTGAGTLGGGSGGISIYNLTTNGSSNSTTLATNNIVISNALNVGTSHTFAMSTNSLTIGSTSISDSGDITMATGSSTSQSASGTVTILGSSNAADWAGPGIFTAYNLTIGNGSNTLSVDNETADLSIDVNNDFNITANATFSASSSSSFTVGNSYSNSGTFTANSGLVTMDAGDSGNTLSGSMTGSSTFYNLRFNNSAGSWTFSNNADVGNDFTITDATAVNAPSSLSVARNFTGSSAFTPGSGTVTLSGAGGTTQTLSGNTTFYNLTANASSSRIIQFTASSTNTINNNLTLTGTNCDALMLLRSTSKGTVWNIDDNTGGTTTVSNVDVQDSTATDQAVTATSSNNSGNNGNWTIAASACEGGSTSITPVSYGFQRKTFFDDTNDVYWMLYHDGDEIEVRYSSDTGTTWNLPSTSSSAHLAYDTSDFSVWNKTISSTEYIFLALKDGFDIKVLVGTLSASNVTWDNDIDTVFDGTSSGDTFSYPYVSLDSSNYVWVGARYYDGTNYVYRTSDSNAIGSTDLSSVGWNPFKQVINNQTNSNVYGNIVPLASQAMYLTVAVGTALRGCIWDDSANDWVDSNDVSCTTESEEYYSTLNNGLISYWRMDETSWNGTSNEVVDSSGNGLHGVRVGDATTENSGFLRSGTFDGSGDYIDAGSPASLDDLPNSDFTVSFWHKYSETGSANFPVFVGKRNYLGSYGWNISTEKTNKYVKLNVLYPGGTDAQFTTDDDAFADGVWSQVTVTWDASTKTGEIFINGIQPSMYNEVSGSGTYTSDASEILRVGHDNVGSPYKGNLDEFRIYDRVLSTSEISQLYQYYPGPINIDNSSDFGSMPGAGRQIIRAGDGDIYAFVNDGGNCEMWKSTNSFTWTQQQPGTTITCSNSNAISTSIDGNADIHVAYFDGTSSLKYRLYDTATDNWDGGVGEENIVTGDTYSSVVVSIDSNNIPHIAVRTTTGAIIGYNNRIGGTWNGSLTTVESTSVTDYLDLTINENNYPAISYITSTSLVAKEGNANDASSFNSSGTIDSTVNTTAGQAGISIAVDSANGDEWVAYIDSGGSVALAKHSGGTWGSGWSTVTTKSDIGSEPSIALAWSNGVYVFYQDDSTDQKIVYDFYNSSGSSPAWVGEKVLLTPSSGVDYKDVKVRWSYLNNPSYSNYSFEYLISDNTDLYFGQLSLPDWLTNWSKRVPIVISNSNIDADLTAFPLNLTVTSTSGTADDDMTLLFDSLGANSKKIAITKSDGTTELYAEVQRWDTTNEIGQLWVSKEDFVLSGSTDTTLYLYYDSNHADNTNYVGDTGSTIAGKVWEPGYKVVAHLDEADDTSRVDASGNGNTMSESASDTVTQYTSGTRIGADFERGDTEFLEVSDNSSLEMSNFTFTAWLNVESTQSSGGAYQAIFTRGDGGNWAYGWATESDSIGTLIDADGFAGGGALPVSASSTFNTGEWNLFHVTYDGSNIRLYKNGVELTSGDYPYATTISINQNSTSSLRLGNWQSQSGYFDGIMDEVMLNSGAKSSAWLKTDYHSMTDNLANWGTSESVAFSTSSQDTIDTIPANIDDNFSATVDSSNNVHIAYVDDESTDQISHRKWTNSTQTWGSATLVPSGASNTHTNISIAINTSAADLNDLYVSWIDSSNNHIYYRQYDSSATSWLTVQDWKTTGTNVYPTLNFSGSGRVFALWNQGTSSPTTIDWGSILAPSGGSAPTVTSVSLNGGSTITLTEGTTTNISVVGTVTDLDGHANISTATAKIYRSGVSGAQSCSNSDNNCYTVASCSLSSCAGNTCTATCTAPLAFHADATDTGSTYASEYWRGWIEATDDDSNTGSGFSSVGSPDLASTAAMDISSSLAFGTLLAGDDTGASPQNTTVTNTGNTTLDFEVSGDDLCTNYPTCSGPQIGVGYQEYKITTFTYGAGTGLTTSPVTVDLNLNKSTAVPSNSTSSFYWGIGIPSPKETGAYTGANTVTALNGGS